MFRYVLNIIFCLVFISQVRGLSQDPPDGDTVDSEYYTIMFELNAVTSSEGWYWPSTGDPFHVNYDNEFVSINSFTDNISEGVNVVRIPKHRFNSVQPLDISLFSMTIEKTDRNCKLTVKNIPVSRKGDTLIFTEIEVSPVRIS